MVSNQKLFVDGNYFARGEFVLYINNSGKYIEINFNMKIPFQPSAVKNEVKIEFDRFFGVITLQTSFLI